MISTPILYLFVLAFIATGFHSLESKTSWKVFKFVPAVVMIYAFSMLLASLGVFEYNQEINSIYSLTKTNLLPAMLFLMLLQVDFRHFFKLGKSLLIAYILALFSLTVGFIVVAVLFDFNKDMASAFGALAGSWMGGTANMIAVGSALEVSESAFAYALVVDSVNYTLWVMLLLFLVPFAHIFNRFTKSEQNMAYIGNIGCACTMGVKRYWLIILLGISASFLAQFIAEYLTILNTTTTIVLVASVLGVLGSFTKLKEMNGSSEVATTMLYIIIALIGSKAVFESFSDVGIYVLAGFLILVIHAVLMVLGAKIFKLDLFSVAVASLSNIGGVASAPILAAAYNKSLVSVGVLMAIMGYLIGTLGGLAVGNILIYYSQIF
ncbi:MAG: DUF819 family protein [Sulfurimonas sp.]|nr:DUF819 family protein [Sulfurimonas sp.]MDQ7060990.1 DUF819 family protein [Sulfurimonas sp.]